MQLPSVLVFATAIGCTTRTSSVADHRETMMTTTDGTPCDMVVDAAGLPQRLPALLARERTSLPGMIESLSAGATKGKGGGAPTLAGTVTADTLLDALGSNDDVRAYAAAFLAGRCKLSDPTASARLTQRLTDHIASNARTDTRIEAAFSLALRGDRARGVEALRAAVASPEPLGDQYKAAFFLAQLGEPSGYPAFLRTARGDIPHYRLMALRHAIAFTPWDGKTIANEKVDVAALLTHGLSDPDPLLRQEMPFYLEELGVTNLRQLLEPVARNDTVEEVRVAAKIVLERLH